MSPNRPLRYWRLIEICQPGDRPLTASALRADERIVNFLKGLSYLDDRLSPMLVPFEADPGGRLPRSQEAAVSLAVRHLRAAADGTAPLVQLLGRTRAGAARRPSRRSRASCRARGVSS